MSKLIIYQVLPRLFGNFNPTRKQGGTKDENGCGKFSSFTPKALREIKNLGVTHIWYTGIIEHATQTDYSSYGIRKDHNAIVKGRAGSPYAIKDYYDVDPDLADKPSQRMKEFLALVKRTHKEGLQVIIDFVPNHVAREYFSDSKPKGVQDLGEEDNPDWAFSPLNNFYYLPGQPFSPQFDKGDYEEYPAKATGNDCFHAYPTQNDWYETIKLNYGVFYQGGGEKQFDPIPNTWNKMLEILLFWASKGVDGFRCDMAEMVPAEFWQWAISKVKEDYPELIFIGEVYNPHLYAHFIQYGGFDYLYDKVGMYDCLRNVICGREPAENITYKWQASGNLLGHMLYFLENHDEQRIASGFFCGGGGYAQPAMIIAATLTQGPVMIYMGQELGENGMDSEGFSGIDGRTTIFDYWGVRSLQAWGDNGQFDGLGLTNDQKQLRVFYAKLLNIAVSESAITDGAMYDLGYAQGEGFNRRQHFAFLRSFADELLLVVTNFDDKKTDISIRLPQDAFSYLHLAQCDRIDAVDLLSSASCRLSLNDHEPVHVELPAWSGVILKMLLNDDGVA